MISSKKYSLVPRINPILVGFSKLGNIPRDVHAIKWSFEEEPSPWDINILRESLLVVINPSPSLSTSPIKFAVVTIPPQSMPTPVRRKQQRCSQPPSPYKRQILPQLRPLAPKLPGHLDTQMQTFGLQLEHNNTRDEPDAEAPTATTANVEIQHSATLQSDIPSRSSGHDFTSPSLLSPHPTASGLKEKQYAVVANIYSSGVPLPSADDGYSALAYESLPPGAKVVTSESRGLSTQHPPNDNLELQQTIQNRHGQDYSVLTRDIPEVWPAMVQPATSVHQGQCSGIS